MLLNAAVPPCPPSGADGGDDGTGPIKPPRLWRPPPEQFSIVETACIVAASPQFWALAAHMPRNLDVVGMRGRKPKTPDYAKLLVACVSWQCLSMLATVTELSFAPAWKVIREVLEAHRKSDWDEVPNDCPGVSQMKSFNAKLARLGDEWRETAITAVSKQAVQDAQALGYLKPQRVASWKKPDSRDFIATDGTVMLPAFGSGADDSLGPQIVFNDERAKNKPIGSKVLTTFVHGDLAGSRIIISADVVPPGPNGSPGGESEPIARAVRTISLSSGGGLRGLIVDSVVRGSLVSELDRQGITVVNYPHAKVNPNRSVGGRHAEGRVERTVEFPPIKHQVRGDSSCEHALVMVGSVPHTRMFDEEGTENLVELRIQDGFRRRNKDGSNRSYHVYEVPCIHGTFNHTHRLFPTGESAINHGESTRYFPTTTEQFTMLYGRRNATESWHAELKRTRRRLPVRGMAMQSFYLCCLVITQNARNIERMRRSSAPPEVDVA